MKSTPKQGNTKMIELLLENNADPTIIGHDESTAVSLAKDVSRRLLNVAIILESSVVYGMMHDLPVLVIKSIQDGAHVNIRSSGGWNPLIYASYYGKYKFVFIRLILDLHIIFHELGFVVQKCKMSRV